MVHYSVSKVFRKESHGPTLKQICIIITMIVMNIIINIVINCSLTSFVRLRIETKNTRVGVNLSRWTFLHEILHVRFRVQHHRTFGKVPTNEMWTLTIHQLGETGR